MNEGQKIELGKALYLDVAFYAQCKVLFNGGDCVMMSDLIINKIQELKNTPGKQHGINKNSLECICGATFDTNQRDNGHICGVCYVVCCPECLEEDFWVCKTCSNDYKRKITIQDKYGRTFSAGDTLRNESSLTTTVKILQINKTHIVSEPGGVTEIQDFIDAGWIVHDRVKGYSRGPKSGKHLDICKFFQATAIGGRVCQDCSHNNGTNTDQQWVICKLYNEENEDEK